MYHIRVSVAKMYIVAIRCALSCNGTMSGSLIGCGILYVRGTHQWLLMAIYQINQHHI